MKEEYLQKIEQIEIQIHYWKNVDYSKDQIQRQIEKAKELKEEIEKGCGEKYFMFGEEVICGEGEVLCGKCQELIERLNKIIGDEE